MENSLELFPIREDLNYSAKESTVDIFDKFLAIYIIDFLGVLQTQNGRNDVWELFFIHFAEKRICALVQVLSFVLS